MNKKVLRLLGIAILIFTAVSVFFATPSESVHKYILIHWPSAVFVLGGTLGILLLWQPVAGFLTAGGRAALIAGLGGELLGGVMILISEKNPAAMEPGISLAAVSLIYGLLLSEMIFRPLRKSAAGDLETVRLGREAASAVARTHYSYSRPSMRTSPSGDRSAGSPV